MGIDLVLIGFVTIGIVIGTVCQRAADNSKTKKLKKIEKALDQREAAINKLERKYAAETYGKGLIMR
ncbi:hypothetical protein RAK27_11960 [Carnobacterium maltaromaticum]|uniref:Uncharacterized protein n=1 Tax=Carnobacterium maltaromaticum TaxID=2751 RepID=A0AAW9JXM7_CARML|nr:hypothetical protein [Carnobacterium maltaromaticum]MDZ5759379.1 hypothetical protein [Carnobacterium maltaromaticum]